MTMSAGREGKSSRHFIPQCSNFAFADEDWITLKKYGRQYSALASGELAPRTEAQERFARHFQSLEEREPEGYHEKLWAKYLFRVEWERDPDNRAAMGPVRQLADESFGTREDFKKLHQGQPDRLFFVRKRR